MTDEALQNRFWQKTTLLGNVIDFVCYLLQDNNVDKCIEDM
jgi:hypothetical protein